MLKYLARVFSRKPMTRSVTASVDPVLAIGHAQIGRLTVRS